MSKSTPVVPFQFDSYKIRTLIDPDGIHLWVAKDIANALGYTNANKAIKDHCKGLTKRYPLKTRGGVQRVLLIHEPDLYRLIVKSKLPTAQKFERWVFEKILPSIRKTGKYVHQPGLTLSQQRAINEAVRDKVESLFEHKPLIRAGYMTIWHQIKEHFGVETYKDIPSGKIDELFEFIKDLGLVKRQLSLPPMDVFQGKDLHLPRPQIKSQIKSMVDQVSDGYLDFMWGCLDRMLRGEGFATSYDPNTSSDNRYFFLRGVP